MGVGKHIIKGSKSGKSMCSVESIGSGCFCIKLIREQSELMSIKIIVPLTQYFSRYFLLIK